MCLYIYIHMWYTYTHTHTHTHFNHNLSQGHSWSPNITCLLCLSFISPEYKWSQYHRESSVNIYWINESRTTQTHTHSVSWCKIYFSVSWWQKKKARNITDQNQTLLFRKSVSFKIDLYLPFITTVLTST